MTELPEGYFIRPATNGDGEQVKAIVYGVLNEYGIRPDPDHANKGLIDIESSFHGGTFDLLISPNGEIVGTVGVLKLSDTICELTKMFLQKNERGKGFGKILLSRALAFAKQNGFQRIELETDTKLREAINLYTRFGFVKSGACDDTRRCNTVMHLTL